MNINYPERRQPESHVNDVSLKFRVKQFRVKPLLPCYVKLRFLSLSILVLFLCVACDFHSSASGTTPLISDLTVTSLNEELVVVDWLDADIKKSIQLSNDVVWQSADETLVTVDNQGVVNFLKVGNVRLTVSINGQKNDISVEIKDSDEMIQGHLQYEDKKYDDLGFITTSEAEYNDIRYVTVDLLNSVGELLLTTTSDQDGRFYFGHIIPSEYSIRIVAEVPASPAPGFSIRDTASKPAVYAVKQSSIKSQTNYLISLSSETETGAAFNMLDVFISAAEFSKKAFNIDVKDLVTYWGDTSPGSYFCAEYDGVNCRSGVGIYVLNSLDDTDHYDDDILLHEFGHFLMKTHFIDDSPGGCHGLTDSDQDLRLAWSEGWGTFFGSAVKQDIPDVMRSSEAPVTSYLDTDGKLAIISYDALRPRSTFENSEPDSFYYASSEVAVNHILWSVYDAYGMRRITDVLANHFGNSTQPTNLPNFWQGLMLSDLLIDDEVTELARIFENRKVIYQEDVFESDDEIVNASVASLEVTLLEPAQFDRYLYKDTLGDDVDLFAIDVEADKSYSISTAELRNGIDTYLRVLNEWGEVVVINNRRLENDDATNGEHYKYTRWCGDYRHFNSTSALASKVSFVANTSSRYYVEVSHMSLDNKVAPAYILGATGPYGSYQLQLTVE